MVFNVEEFFLSVFVENVCSKVRFIRLITNWNSMSRGWMLKGKQGTHIDKQQWLYGARNAQTNKKNCHLYSKSVELLDFSYLVFCLKKSFHVSFFSIARHERFQWSSVFLFVRLVIFKIGRSVKTIPSSLFARDTYNV